MFLNVQNWIGSVGISLLAHYKVLQNLSLWHCAFNVLPFAETSCRLHFIKSDEIFKALGNWILPHPCFLKLWNKYCVLTGCIKLIQICETRVIKLKFLSIFPIVLPCIFWRVLAMFHDTLLCWVSGLRQTVRYTNRHNVSLAGSNSVSGKEFGGTCSVGSIRKT